MKAWPMNGKNRAQRARLYDGFAAMQTAREMPVSPIVRKSTILTMLAAMFGGKRK